MLDKRNLRRVPLGAIFLHACALFTAFSLGVWFGAFSVRDELSASLQACIDGQVKEAVKELNKDGAP